MNIARIRLLSWHSFRTDTASKEAGKLKFQENHARRRKDLASLNPADSKSGRIATRRWRRQDKGIRRLQGLAAAVQVIPAAATTRV
jgi:hypothetical protein